MSVTSTNAASGQVKLPLTKPGRLGRLKNDQPSSQLTLPNVPPAMNGLALTKVGGVPVHGATIWKPTAGFSMMLFDEKNRYVPNDADAAGIANRKSCDMSRIDSILRFRKQETRRNSQVAVGGDKLR